MSRRNRASFDYSIGQCEHFFGKIESERCSGLKIDNEIELGRLLDRKIGRLGALQDLDPVQLIGTAPYVLSTPALPSRVTRMVLCIR